MNADALFHLFLIALSAVIVVSVVWYTLRTGSSPMPSSRKAVRAILEELQHHQGPVADLGSGWGSLAAAIASEYPERKVTGYELSLLPWLVSMARKKVRRLDNLTLLREDFFRAELARFPVITCYLHPKGMRELEARLVRDDGVEYRVISNTFAMPTLKPEKTLKLDDMYRSQVLVYRIGGRHVSEYI